MRIKIWFFAFALLCLVPFAMAKEKYSRVSSVEEYDSIVVSFAKGSHKLPGKHVEMLRELVRKAQARGNISKIEIAAWSDKEHPSTGTLSKAGRTLADKRLKTVKDVLRRDIGSMSYIGTYNMAENAHWLGRVFNTSEAELDAVFAKKEVGALDRQDFKLIKRDGKPSKAVVIFKIRKK